MRWPGRTGMCLLTITCGMLASGNAGCGRATNSTDKNDEMPLRQVSTETAQPHLPKVSEASTSNAEPAKSLLVQASQSGKYVFLFVWKQDDETTRRMRAVFDSALAKVAERAVGADVLLTAVNQREFVEEYDLARAPLPLALAFAPNGAITGGFPTQFTEEDLLGAFATPATEKSMKQLQDGKLVLLCVQNEASMQREAALAGVEEFTRDPRFSSASEIVMLDPADTAEASFLRDLQITSTSTAVTVLLAPPGSPVAMFEGAISKDQLVESVEKAGKGCCPGGQCGPNGCNPK